MTEQDGFKHYLLKCHEALFLIHRHYIPMGKQWPEHYNKLMYSLFKTYENGDIPEFGEEPVMEQEVKQLDIFMHIQSESDEVAEKEPVPEVGTMFDNLNETADNP